MVVVTLTPFIPLSLEGEGEEYEKRGYAPLKRPYYLRARRVKEKQSLSYT